MNELLTSQTLVLIESEIITQNKARHFFLMIT